MNKATLIKGILILAILFAAITLLRNPNKERMALQRLGGDAQGGMHTAAEGEKQNVVTLTPVTGYEAPVVVEEKIREGSQTPETLRQLTEQREEAGLSEEKIAECMERQKGRYMYDTMDASLRRLYAELYMILSSHAENILISATDPSELQVAFLCVFQDHPELYWIDGYSYRRFGNGGKVYISFSGKYTYSPGECRIWDKKLEDMLAGFMKELPRNADDYEKVRHCYEYIIWNTDYRVESKDNQNILSVLLNGESVCQGYAKAFQYLLEKLDVPCTMVVGKVYGGEGHAWNLVKIEGEWYYVDTTWGDAGYMSAGGAAAAQGSEINYNYLNVTRSEMEASHTFDNVVIMPYCNATADNYFVREDRYFDRYDTEALQELFDEAGRGTERSVSFKCADHATFERYAEELLDQRRIFELLPKDSSSVDYTVDEELNVFTFWF
ncbi:MAG: hypothetical protein IKO11_09520 [Lachnospiraceae bacterium]|nr:hypothetical protein [Lachnospiraceae bacterium]